MTRDTRPTWSAHGRAAVGAAAGDVVGCLDDAEAYVALICFKHGPPRRIGVELEWTVHHRAHPDRPLDLAHLGRALGVHAPTTLTPTSTHEPLAGGSRITVEPGGQVEISSTPASSLDRLVADVEADISHLDALLTPAGLYRGAAGIDPARAPLRLLDLPRYQAMQAFFDRIGPWGSAMMCSTASTQVCIDAGEIGQAERRWAALHSIGPTLVALFANSPVVAGRDTGWASNRLRATVGTCPPVTQPPLSHGDPVEAWVATVMSAPVLCLRGHGPCWDTPRPMSFAEWIGGAVATPPTYDDLDYHLTTLFPPVRPRGYLEVRYLDTQPPDRWHHPLVLLAALTSSPEAVEACLDLTEHCADRWLTAARDGLRDETLRSAARALVDVARDHAPAAPDSGLDAHTVLDDLETRTATVDARRLLA